MHKRLTLSLIALALCSLTLRADPREELLRMFPEAAGYVYELRDEDAELVAMLTNPGVRTGMQVDPKTTSVPFRFTRIENKREKTTTFFRSDMVDLDREARLISKDVSNDVIIDDEPFPDHTPPGGTLYPSLNACIADFNCKHKSELECLANSTCKPQAAALTCCMTDGSCASVHLVFKPTSLKCKLIDIIPPVLEGIVLAP